MINEDDAQHIADLIEARMHQNAVSKIVTRRVHWGRRISLVVVVLLTGYATHKVLEIPEVAAAAQSFELLLASMIDSIYARVKDMA